MTEKELRKLNRRDLLEMLIYQTKRTAELEKKLKDAEGRLEEKNIALKRAGSIAQASLQVSGIFEAADEAAYRFLESIKESTGEEAKDPIDIFESLRYLDEYREGRKTEVIISGDDIRKSIEQEKTKSYNIAQNNVQSEKVTKSEADSSLHPPVSIEAINSLFAGEVSDSGPDSKTDDFTPSESEAEAYYINKAKERAREYEESLKKEIDRKMEEYRDYVRERFFGATKELEQIFSILSRDEFDRLALDTRSKGEEIWSRTGDGVKTD